MSKRLLRASKQVHKVAAQLVGSGMRMFVVGGAVRDALLGEKPKDLDLVVVGGSLEDVVAKFKSMGVPVREKVVSDAPVFHALLDSEWVDVAVARREELREGVEGTGQQEDFVFHTGSDVSLMDDLRRRDFTVNAMAMDVVTGDLHDPFGGQHDLFSDRRGRLMPVDGKLFRQSAERVLRGAQLVARKGLAMTPVMMALGREMHDAVAKVSVEQWWRQWEKLLLSDNPSAGVRALVLMGCADLLPGWPEMMVTEQDPVWHPEGKVDEHTLMVLDAAVALTREADRDTKLKVRMAALLHDLAKPDVTFVREDGRVVSPGHAARKLLAPKAMAFMARVGFPNRLRREVVNLCVEHMREAQTHKSVRKLARDLAPARLADWALLVCSDMAGRDVPAEEVEAGWARVSRTLELAEELSVVDAPPVELVLGRHLLAEGLKPGPEVGRLLRVAAEAQMDGLFDTVEGGLDFLRSEGLL